MNTTVEYDVETSVASTWGSAVPLCIRVELVRTTVTTRPGDDPSTFVTDYERTVLQTWLLTTDSDLRHHDPTGPTT